MKWLRLLRAPPEDVDELQKAADLADRLEQVAAQLEETSRQLALRVAEMKGKGDIA